MPLPNRDRKGAGAFGSFSPLVRAAILFGTLAGPAIQGVLAQPLEYQVKAAFLLNFTKFVEWPPSAFPDEASPLSICVLGEDPFAGALDQVVEGESANGRKLAVQKLKNPPSSKACQVLFVNKNEKEVDKILARLGPGVLTAGDGDGFLRDGGMIAFVIENRRVRFDVNQIAVEGAALRISSKLLNVARSVKK